MIMMLFHYSFMIPALIACLILAGVHTYFGYHIVERGVIFVDLSLSQIAALGASVALLFGWGEDAPVKSFAMSLAFTFGGAVLFALLRRFQKIVPMEALIGIAYAGAIALSLLALEKSATGTEHIKEMLVGTILTVSWRDIMQLGGIVLFVALLHGIFCKRLFQISENPEAAAARGIRVWLWDVFFYATFGIVVTSSVKIAGVLLIFSLLIIPAVTAVICANGTFRRVALGWCFGAVACVLGLEFSLRMDCAAGPSIITTMMAMMGLSALVSFILKKTAKRVHV
jgi:zinc/manganese transport system permease protein